MQPSSPSPAAAAPSFFQRLGSRCLCIAVPEQMEPAAPIAPEVAAASVQPAAAVGLVTESPHLESNRPSDYLHTKWSVEDFLPEVWAKNTLRINPTDPIDESSDANLKGIPKTLHKYYFQSLALLPSTVWYKKVCSEIIKAPENLEYFFKRRALMETKILWFVACTSSCSANSRKGIEVDLLRGMIILQEIANEKGPEMQDIRLWAEGQIYDQPNVDGTGKVDAAKATACFRQSAEMGNSHAQYVLSRSIFETPNGDDEEAMKWLCASAIQGNQWAQVLLGEFYLTHSEEEHLLKIKDLNKPFWLMGHRGAVCFGKEREAAALLYEAAAAQGHNGAKYDLAEMYRDKFLFCREVAYKGLEQARIWYAKKEIALYQSAAEEGYEPAAQRLRDIKTD